MPNYKGALYFKTRLNHVWLQKQLVAKVTNALSDHNKICLAQSDKNRPRVITLDAIRGVYYKEKHLKKVNNT